VCFARVHIPKEKVFETIAASNKIFLKARQTFSDMIKARALIPKRLCYCNSNGNKEPRAGKYSVG
jgi:hypothetical protein